MRSCVLYRGAFTEGLDVKRWGEVCSIHRDPQETDLLQLPGQLTEPASVCAASCVAIPISFGVAIPVGILCGDPLVFLVLLKKLSQTNNVGTVGSVHAILRAL